MLTGKNAVVTGGGAGIGYEIVKKLSRMGANVVVCDINTEAAEKAAAELAEAGTKAIALTMDVSRIEGHKETVEYIEENFGQIDILVNNAGVSYSCSVMEMTPALWDKVQGINLRGGFFLSQAVFEKMLERKKGRIVNIASVSGDRPAEFSDPAYSISKAGVLMMTKVYAKAAAGTEITVNAVGPGLIETELAKRIGIVVDPGKVPLARMGTPAEVADAVGFLVSDDAKYITGQNIRVNGGQFML